jgi:hypothetical protein
MFTARCAFAVFGFEKELLTGTIFAELRFLRLIRYSLPFDLGFLEHMFFSSLDPLQ